MNILRYILKLQLLVLTSLTCFCFVSVARADNLPFVICYENIENIPYYYGEGSDVPKTKPGLYVDILDLVSQRLKLKIIFHRAPWARCLKQLELNRVDGVLAASFKTERAKYSHYPMNLKKLDVERRIVNKSYYIFRRKGARISWDGKEFNGTYRVGVQIGYTIIDFLKKHNLTVTATPSVQRGFQQVQNNRLDAFATIEEIGNTLLMRYPNKYSNVEKVTVPLTTKPYYLIIGRKFYKTHRYLSENIWNELAKIRESEMPNLLIHYSVTTQ
ncbi:MAG: transporter substrate-binding domain-containing protein [Halopseudomonas aestusnigri]